MAEITDGEPQRRAPEFLLVRVSKSGNCHVALSDVKTWDQFVAYMQSNRGSVLAINPVCDIANLRITPLSCQSPALLDDEPVMINVSSNADYSNCLAHAPRDIQFQTSHRCHQNGHQESQKISKP